MVTMQLPSTLRILFADDDAETRNYFQELLSRLGHQAFTVSNGRELVELAPKVEPDLIITDIMMPGKDGIEAATEVSQAKQIPVILVSAHEGPELYNRIGTDHIMNFLIKPVNEADVRAAITVAMLRFQQYRAVCDEASNLRQALENRKLLERAKGSVMKRLRIEEDEAFGVMKKMASVSNRKLIDIAREIVEAEQVYYRLEQL
jgi:two-component system, response regulator PdtaR